MCHCTNGNDAPRNYKDLLHAVGWLHCDGGSSGSMRLWVTMAAVVVFVFVGIVVDSLQYL